ncbi:hypothetical protein SAMN04488104_101417 [Algoriphagus faecimaris]|uniref:DUF4476 domain-containing protein n=1 Tax=Algoriphagus faecimaris TaxID=686796 RepID=A0A1G6RVA8_9BACT|nr:hypothetical protein [Algoriphagus faecimaris]SDD07865.1 hypothetical protein SAMN04488104_101417 [Algoriphagus faecimaris]
MRKYVLLFFCLFTFYSLAEARPETKTFLVLFKSKELKANETSLKSIEAQFSSFSTRSYSGNSELALLIEIPSCDFDECFLGQFLIDTGKKNNIQLQEVAFRLFDMTQSKRELEMMLQAYDSENSKKSKKLASTAIPSL